MTGDVQTALAEVEREIAARRPEHAIDPTLDRIADLAALLGDPQRACPVIHITGTNGKTSTARMIETLLRTRGLRTGLFTSPHLSSMTERIMLDGAPIDPQRFVDLYEELAPYLAIVDGRHEVRLSFFEVLTAMAFAAFADAPVDVAVVEVGLGGTWDSTNIADGDVAVVTPISLDHTRYLGSTVEAIATDKSGIIKPGAIAVLAQQPLPAAEVLLRRTAEVGATVAREGLEFGVLAGGRQLGVGGQRLELRGLRGDYHEIFLPLFGAHQAGNAACALAAVEAFAGPGDGGPDGDGTGPLDEELIRGAFASVRSPGRLEVVRRSPVTIVDAAHNPAGMAASMEAITEAFSFASLTCVLAVSADKDVPAILDELEPVADNLVVTRNSSHRSMDVAKLAELAESVFGPDRVRAAARLDEAISIAVELADQSAPADGGDPLVPDSSGVLITGSVITAGDARTLLAPPARPLADAERDDERDVNRDDGADERETGPDGDPGEPDLA